MSLHRGYQVVTPEGTIFDKPDFRAARAAFEVQTTADLIADGYRIARRVDGQRVPIVAEKVGATA